MATHFNNLHDDLTKNIHDFSSNSFKLALITSAVTPAIGDALPHFGGTGTTNYATNQVTPGGNYASGGPALTNVTVNTVAGVTTVRANMVEIAQDASNPTDARWGIIYNDTLATKRAIAFVDLGSVRNLTTGAFRIRFDSQETDGGIFSLQRSA